MAAGISATRDLPADPAQVFAFLAELANHWQLEDHFVALDEVYDHGGSVRMRGPLGLSRVARTRVVEAAPNGRLRGVAVVGSTTARVGWDIEPNGHGSRVTLSAELERAAPIDAILLALGGRRYLRRIFARTLANLERVLAGP